MAVTPLKIADRQFASRLILGTGKFASPELMRDALEASGAEMVTVALRRVDLSGENDPFANILQFIDSDRFLLLPNTSGAMNAEEAVRLARLAEAAGLPKWVKLEIHPDSRYLLPDPVETLAAAEQLVKEGFTVLPYINADPVIAKRLQEAGCATVMPLGAPIGTNRGIETRDLIRIILDQATVPVVVDAGMNDLLRPALYDARHRILPLDEAAPDVEESPADVVGPVCETGDSFAVARPLPPLAEGDLLAICSAGAYGAVMASTYNSRPLVPEVMVRDKAYAVVRPRLEFDALLTMERTPCWQEAGGDTDTDSGAEGTA